MAAIRSAKQKLNATGFEKLGAFYLGNLYDPKAQRATDEILLYDARDLTIERLF
jgi:hypothetical protein